MMTAGAHVGAHVLSWLGPLTTAQDRGSSGSLPRSLVIASIVTGFVVILLAQYSTYRGQRATGRSVETRRGIITIRCEPDPNAHAGDAFFRSLIKTTPGWGRWWFVSVSGPGVGELGFVEPERVASRREARARAAEIAALVLAADSVDPADPADPTDREALDATEHEQPPRSAWLAADFGIHFVAVDRVQANVLEAEARTTGTLSAMGEALAQCQTCGATIFDNCDGTFVVANHPTNPSATHPHADHKLRSFAALELVILEHRH